jgi:hypothetical protein
MGIAALAVVATTGGSSSSPAVSYYDLASLKDV